MTLFQTILQSTQASQVQSCHSAQSSGLNSYLLLSYQPKQQNQHAYSLINIPVSLQLFNEQWTGSLASTQQLFYNFTLFQNGMNGILQYPQLTPYSAHSSNLHLLVLNSPTMCGSKPSWNRPLSICKSFVSLNRVPTQLCTQGPILEFLKSVVSAQLLPPVKIADLQAHSAPLSGTL